MLDAHDNPNALPGAPLPRVDRVAIAGTSLYAEVRGSGPAVMLIPGGAEDAEGWRPVAERLGRFTVVTYDRRGTLRSGRDDWPGSGAPQHADDAAALLRALGLDDVVVVGGSSGGVIAVELALRHPGLVRRVLAYEPGYLAIVPDGRQLQGSVRATIETHLVTHPGDWAGAYDAFAATAPDYASEPHGFVAPPGGHGWYAERERLNAEPFVRDDVPIITVQPLDAVALATCVVELRFAHGSRAQPTFRAIVERLAAIRGGAPDVIDGPGHALYLHPDAAAAYIRELGEP